MVCKNGLEGGGWRRGGGVGGKGGDGGGGGGCTPSCNHPTRDLFCHIEKLA